MRLSLTLLALTCAPLALAQVLRYPAGLARAHPRQLDSSASQPDNSCAGLYTRNQTTCQCNSGLVDPGSISKECTCPDYPNTEVLITEVIYDDEAGTITFGSSCFCRGGGQKYDETTRQCKCKTGYHGTRNRKNVLKCTKPGGITTTTVHHSYTSSSASATATVKFTQKKKSLEDAIAIRKRDGDSDETGDLERELGCTASEQACNVGGIWLCTDVLSSLGSCGGCTGVAMDCSALPGVDTIQCSGGQCAIDSCDKGWSLQNTTFVNLPQLCVPKASKFKTTFG